MLPSSSYLPDVCTLYLLVYLSFLPTLINGFSSNRRGASPINSNPCSIKNQVHSKHNILHDHAIIKHCSAAAGDTDTEIESTESYFDQRLRDFFANRQHFLAAQYVVDSVLLSQNERQSQPLLLFSKVNNLQQEKEPDNELFDILYHSYNLHDFDELYTNNKDDKTTHHQEDIHVNQPSKRKQKSFKIKLAYRGKDFCGWQIQLQNSNLLPSVQQTIIDRLHPLLNSNSNFNSNKPLDVRVCGRTDSGVSAIGQYCRVRTHENVGVDDIQKAINHGICHKSKNGPLLSVGLCCTNVEQVSEKFHPTFDACCRAYIYLIDAPPLLALCQEMIPGRSRNFSLEEIVVVMNSMFGMIEGKTLDYIAFSFGKVKTENTLCTLSHIRARVVQTNCGHDNGGNGREPKMAAVAIELVGDRFLRRMVRILVSTTIREVLLELQETNGQGLLDEVIDDAEMETKSRTTTASTRLLSIVKEEDRSQTAKAAASDGLLFVGARFRD
mmetsp:Transcript_1762/g.3189  ORF Transcript_1762/g.3189 Transcript_1762/m.3189 type:complete len:496 (-) Transcript_1762:2328-3815(-)